MENVLNYEELQKLAMKNYTKGGDVVVECWDKRAFDDYCAEVGPMTESDALHLFRMYKSACQW